MTEASTLIQQAILQTSTVEWLAFFTALLYILFAIKENPWCWWFGIISCALSVYLCITANLYLESVLQLFYIGFGFYGWYQWKYAATNATLPVITINKNLTLKILALGFIIWPLLAIVVQRFSNQALPWLDAFITIFSLLATWLSARKYLQNWIFWFVIDALAIYLYFARGYYLLSVIYVFYTILTIPGYIKWSKQVVK